MKRILLHNWKIKLTCLLLAFIIWTVIQRGFINVPAEGRAAASEHFAK